MQANSTERVLKGAIAVLLIAFCWVIVDTLRERLVNVGDKAPSFSVTTDSRKKLTRSNFG